MINNRKTLTALKCGMGQLVESDDRSPNGVPNQQYRREIVLPYIHPRSKNIKSARKYPNSQQEFADRIERHLW